MSQLLLSGPDTLADNITITSRGEFSTPAEPAVSAKQNVAEQQADFKPLK